MPCSRLLAIVLVAVTAPLVAACSPLGALRTAAQPLEAYTLTPAAFQPGTAATARHLLVEPPAASAAIDTDRILVMPSPLQVQYLPGARWVDSAPDLMQALIVETLQNTGAFRFVTRTTTGPFPDYTLLGELLEFQAEATGDPQVPLQVRVTMSLALVREDDRAIVSSRRVTASRAVASGQTSDVVTAFDAATDQVLAETAAWVLSVFGVRPS
jgi:cholesterol transport system auxiliary component